MANVSKSIFQKYRNHLLWDVTAALSQLTKQVNDLSIKVGEAEKAIQQTHLEINHTQSTVLDELNQRVKNSGTIALSETELVTKIFSGLKMYLDPRDLAITPHLALDSIWEHRITAAWLRLLQLDSTVLDIGANNGYYGALAAQQADKKKAKIVMFEANPHLIPYIKKTLAVNFLGEQTVLENLAVADTEGTLTLNILKDYIGSSSVYSDEQVKTYMPNKWDVETQEAVKVQAVTIDSYCKKHTIPAVDLIIMDIEGFEDKAYAGMRKTIAASPNPTLFVEFTQAAYKNPQEFYEQMLQDFGYVYTLNDDGRLVTPKDTRYETVIGNPDDWVMPVFSKNAQLADK